MPKGIVQFFNAHKGYGFITPVDEPTTKVFIHKSELATFLVTNEIPESSFTEGYPIEYDLGDKKSKYDNAINLRVPAPPHV